LALCVSERIAVLGAPSSSKIYFIASRSQGRDSLRVWDSERGTVTTIFDSEGRLFNVRGPSSLSVVPAKIGTKIALIEEGADLPNRVLLFANLKRDTVPSTLFAPDPELRSRLANTAQWRRWKTRSGIEGRGVLFLPRGFDRSRRYPLVVNSYYCSGGLIEGGGGDGALEASLIESGIAALCVDLPADEIDSYGSRPTDMYQISVELLEDAADAFIKEGWVDPRYVGLTGQSFGANVATLALGESQLFSVAALRHGSAIEADAYRLFETSDHDRGPSGFWAQYGLGSDPSGDKAPLWKSLSAVANADRILSPVLLQVDDNEYRAALPFWSSLHALQRPVELIVFPKETHLLSQPIHRLVNFERQLEWFRFWFRSPKLSNTGEDILRWRRMRDLTCAKKPPAIYPRLCDLPAPELSVGGQP
jgi:dipeptidyl aminopeptidase/acylaminoacyl peptidase